MSCHEFNVQLSRLQLSVPPEAKTNITGCFENPNNYILGKKYRAPMVSFLILRAAQQRHKFAEIMTPKHV